MLSLLSSGFSRKFPRSFVNLKNVLTFRLIIAYSSSPSFAGVAWVEYIGAGGATGPAGRARATIGIRTNQI